MDNLNTHSIASLYATFPPQHARELAERLEIYINEYHSPWELRRAIGEHIQKYNTRHPHHALDNKTPDDVYYTPFSRSATNAADLDSAPLAC